MRIESTGVSLSRRRALAAAGAALGTCWIADRKAAAAEGEQKPVRVIRNGRINQCISMSTMRGVKLDRAAPILAQMGIQGVDLLGPDQWGPLKANGLICSMTRSHALAKGLNHTGNHEECLAALRTAIEATAEAGYPNVITFSGNRDGISDDEGARHCITALKAVAGLVEKKKVTICMELLNSKLNHKDYQCDSAEWGAAVIRAVGSERVKLLYDIYHMQVQEGDLIATIKKHHECFAHYHTAGVPGRHEIDETQEINYPAVMQVILSTGFKGYVAHEYSPTRDPFASLAQAMKTCDV